MFIYKGMNDNILLMFLSACNKRNNDLKTNYYPFTDTVYSKSSSISYVYLGLKARIELYIGFR